MASLTHSAATLQTHKASTRKLIPLKFPLSSRQKVLCHTSTSKLPFGVWTSDEFCKHTFLSACKHKL